MSANVETAAYANTPAWHREGVVLDTDGSLGMTPEEAQKAAGIDWEVELVPAFDLIGGPVIANAKDLERIQAQGIEFSANNLQLVEGKRNVRRKTDGKVLGTVGDTWHPTQPLEAFEILNDAMGLGPEEFDMPMWIEAAGALDGGKKIWVLAHLDKSIQIAGEDYVSYLLFYTGFDGRTSNTAAATDVRVVCQNTVDLAIGEAKNLKRIGDMKVGDRQVRVRHTKNAGERIKEARRILGIRDKHLEALAIQGEWLVEQEMSDGQFNSFLEKLMPEPDDEKEKSPARTMVLNRRDKVRGHYFDAKNLDPIRGTRWGAYNAVVEYMDYGREYKSDSTQLKAQWGVAGSRALKDDAFAILTTAKI